MQPHEIAKSAPNSSYRLQRTRRLENINIQGKKFGQSKVIFESQSTKPQIKVNTKDSKNKSADLSYLNIGNNEAQSQSAIQQTIAHLYGVT